MVRSLISEQNFAIHLTKVKRFLRHPHHKVDVKKIAAADYAQAIVLAVKAHRPIAPTMVPAQMSLEDYEFLVVFANTELWMPYEEAKH